MSSWWTTLHYYDATICYVIMFTINHSQLNIVQKKSKAFVPMCYVDHLGMHLQNSIAKELLCTCSRTSTAHRLTKKIVNLKWTSLRISTETPKAFSTRHYWSEPLQCVVDTMMRRGRMGHATTRRLSTIIIIIIIMSNDLFWWAWNMLFEVGIIWIALCRN